MLYLVLLPAYLVALLVTQATRVMLHSWSQPPPSPIMTNLFDIFTTLNSDLFFGVASWFLLALVVVLVASLLVVSVVACHYFYYKPESHQNHLRTTKSQPKPCKAQHKVIQILKSERFTGGHELIAWWPSMLQKNKVKLMV